MRLQSLNWKELLQALDPSLRSPSLYKVSQSPWRCLPRPLTLDASHLLLSMGESFEFFRRFTGWGADQVAVLPNFWKPCVSKQGWSVCIKNRLKEKAGCLLNASAMTFWVQKFTVVLDSVGLSLKKVFCAGLMRGKWGARLRSGSTLRATTMIRCKWNWKETWQEVNRDLEVRATRSYWKRRGFHLGFARCTFFFCLRGVLCGVWKSGFF